MLNELISPFFLCMADLWKSLYASLNASPKIHANSQRIHNELDSGFCQQKPHIRKGKPRQHSPLEASRLAATD